MPNPVRPPLAGILLVLAACAAPLAASPAGKKPPAPASGPCSGVEWKQLDFWLGEWELTWPTTGPTPAGSGTNRIEKILGGCVVQEHFHGSGTPPLTGMSVSTYSPRIKKWQQTWVDDQGSYIDLVGGLENGEMTLSREAPGPDGKPRIARMVFTHIAKNSLDWRWEASTDGGKTWQVNWLIHYARKKG